MLPCPWLATQPFVPQRTHALADSHPQLAVAIAREIQAEIQFDKVSPAAPILRQFLPYFAEDLDDAVDSLSDGTTKQVLAPQAREFGQFVKSFLGRGR